jgi:signal transduction histidine kinase
MRCLTNLLANALKFTPEDGEAVVRDTNSKSAAGSIAIWVSYIR